MNQVKIEAVIIVVHKCQYKNQPVRVCSNFGEQKNIPADASKFQSIRRTVVQQKPKITRPAAAARPDK